MTGELISLDICKNGLNCLARIHAPEGLKVRRFDYLFQRRANFDWHGGRSAADNNAPKKPWPFRDCKEQRGRPNVRTHCMGTFKPKLLYDTSNELAHCRGREQIVPSLRVTESRQVNGDK